MGREIVLYLGRPLKDNRELIRDAYVSMGEIYKAINGQHNDGYTTEYYGSSPVLN